MATTLQNKMETIVHEATETANTNLRSLMGDARTTARKAVLAHVGLFAMAYDHVKSLTENFDSIVGDAGERATSLFETAVERGASIEGVALDRAERVRSEATDRFGDIESRIKQTLGRAEETVTEEVVVVETAVADAQEAVGELVEAVAEAVAAPFEGYHELTAKDVIGRLEGLTQEQLATVKLYEAENANRVTVIREVDRLLADI